MSKCANSEPLYPWEERLELLSALATVEEGIRKSGLPPSTHQAGIAVHVIDQIAEVVVLRGPFQPDATTDVGLYVLQRLGWRAWWLSSG